MAYDVFISYRHSRKNEVQALCAQLQSAGLSVFRDEEERDTDASIQHGIEHGLAASKLLLAWYDPTYLQSKACAWEFSRALVAAHAGGAGLQRIVCVDPTGSFGHIVPEALRDQARLASSTDPAALVRLLRERADACAEPLGRLAAGHTAGWYERERPSHPTWVGRAAELIRLFHTLDHGRLAMHGGARAPVAITGWGGEGKTMLAEQYALRFAAAYPGGVVWLSGATEDGVTPRAGQWLEQLESSLMAVATGKLRLPVGELVHGMADPVLRIRTLKAAIDRALRHRAGIDKTPAIAPYLWIVDDLPDRLSSKEQQLWLPPDEHAHCIATLREAGGVQGVFHALPVGMLSEGEALQILGKRGVPQSDEEQAMAREIVEAVGRLPLALELGAALVESRGYARYRQLLHAPGTGALDRLVTALGTALPTGHEQSIAATFLRSLEQLPQADTATASNDARACWIVLRLTTLLAPEPLPDGFAIRVLAAFGFDTAQAEDLLDVALATLQRTAVTRRDADGPLMRSRIHALMARTVIETRLGPSHREELVACAIFAAAGWAAVEAKKPAVDSDRTLLSIAQALVAVASTPEAAALAQDVGDEARRIGLLESSKRLLASAATVRSETLGQEHLDTLTSMNNLASTIQAQGDLLAARALQDQVLAACRRVLGEEHPDTLTSMNNVASTMQAQGDLLAARTLQEQVRAARRRALGEEHPVTLISMNNLAVTMKALGDVPAARALQEQVLALHRQVLGAEHPDTLTSMSNLAVTMQDQGNLPAARAMHEQVLAARCPMLGEEHPDTLSSMNNLALTMWSQGDRHAARALQDRVLAACRRVLGEEHPNTLTSMNNLALTLQAEGDQPAARAMQEQVLAIHHRVLGEEHPDTLTSMNNLAVTMQDQGDLPAARAMQEQVLIIQRRVLGEEHPDALTSMNNLAVTMQAQRDLPAARELLEQVLAVRRRVLGEEHPDTDAAHWTLYETLLAMKDLAAVESHEAAIEKRLTDTGRIGAAQQSLHDHFDTRRAANGLPGRVERNVGDDFDEASAP